MSLNCSERIYAFTTKNKTLSRHSTVETSRILGITSPSKSSANLSLIPALNPSHLVNSKSPDLNHLILDKLPNFLIFIMNIVNPCWFKSPDLNPLVLITHHKILNQRSRGRIYSSPTNLLQRKNQHHFFSI
jgi:hypothetical protein